VGFKQKTKITEKVTPFKYTVYTPILAIFVVTSFIKPYFRKTGWMR